jgi:hypothetical protein
VEKEDEGDSHDDDDDEDRKDSSISKWNIFLYHCPAIRSYLSQMH